MQPEAPFEMANLFPNHTGLPFAVWISCGTGEVRVSASSSESEMASVAIRPTVHVVEGEIDPTDLLLLSTWIDLNRDVLIQYWNGDIDTKDALDAIRPIE
jgi:hypothetical protein